jgi:hypothetical protein
VLNEMSPPVEGMDRRESADVYEVAVDLRLA